MNVHVRSTGITRFGRRSESLLDLLAEAGRSALEPVGRAPVDLLVVGSMLAGSLGEGENLVAQTAARLGLEGVGGFRVGAASASGAAVVHAAALELIGGSHRRALVIAGEKMTGKPASEVTTALSRSLAPSEFAAGATMPAMAALLAQRYLAQHGLDIESVDAVTVYARSRATLNPNAQFRRAVSAQDVSASRVISSPLRLLHCSAISDGAAAVLLERGHGPVELAGLGQSVDELSVLDRAELTSFRATRIAAQRAFTMAKLSPKAVSLVELHDAFSPFALMNLEDLGLCPPGRSPRYFGSAAAGGGERPWVNPSGGLLGRGHPVGASGLVQIAEVSRQLNGDAGPMAVPETPSVGLCQSIGGLGSHNFVTLLAKGTPP